MHRKTCEGQYCSDIPETREDARFEDIGSVLDMDLFLPFRLSLEDFLRQLDEIRLTAEVSQSNMEADGGPGSGRYPKG